MPKEATPSFPNQIDVNISQPSEHLTNALSDIQTSLESLKTSDFKHAQDIAVIQSKIENWYSLVEPLLARHQEEIQAIQNAANIAVNAANQGSTNVINNSMTLMTVVGVITALTAIGVAVGAIFWQRSLAKEKKEHVRDAIKSIEQTLADGIIPKKSNIRLKLLNEIFQSKEFKEALDAHLSFNKETNNYGERSAYDDKDITPSPDDIDNLKEE